MYHWVLSPSVYSILYLVVGIAIVIVGGSHRPLKSNEQVYVSRTWIWGLIFLTVLMTQDIAKPLFEIWPLDYRSADMLPVIEVMVERGIHGMKAYEPIPEIWGGMQPIYLPGLWMPYIISYISEIDLRWTSMIFLLTGSLMLLRPCKKDLWTVPNLLQYYLLIIGLWMTWLYWDQAMIALTEEGIVIAYYGLLCLALITDRSLYIGIAIGCCIMSRYMLAPWAAMFVIAVWIWKERSQAYTIMLSAGTTILLLMTIGQGWSAIPVFLEVPDNYLTAVLSGKDKYSNLIDSNLGLAKFWKYEALGSLHLLLKIMAFLIPISCILIYKKWFRCMSLPLFGLLSLKLSLIFFFNLLVVPYGYLFYTSTIVSIAIVGYVLTIKEGDNLSMC